MADNAVGVIYNRLHHFLTDAPWEALQINERRLQVMNQCSQTRIVRGFSLIVDDSGHRKSAECTPHSTSRHCSRRSTAGEDAVLNAFKVGRGGNFTAGVGRQYIGEIGKTDNGIVAVTTHLYDGKKSLPLDIELYQHSSSLAQGKKDDEFKKKPALALLLIDRSKERGYRLLNCVNRCRIRQQYDLSQRTGDKEAEIFRRIG